MTTKQKNDHQERLIPQTKRLVEGGLQPEVRSEIRALLAGFCAQFYKGEHLPKVPIDRTTPPTAGSDKKAVSAPTIVEGELADPTNK